MKVSRLPPSSPPSLPLNLTHTPRATSSPQIITQEDHDAYFSYVVKRGAAGALLGLALCVPAHFALARSSAYYRALPLQRRAYGSLFIVLPSLSIAADLAALEYERSRWTATERRGLDVMENQRGARWAAMDRWQRSREWAGEHKYGMIAGA